jgi:hypothetical protein
MLAPRVLATLALAATLAGCSSTGGTALGLFPLPKFLDGEIEGDAYIGGDGLFRVALPHPEESYEFTYMSVKEEEINGSFYVSFGPAAFDQSIYRVEFGLADDHATLAANFDTTFEAAVAHYAGQLQAGYGAPLVLTSESREPLGGRPARSRTYTQLVPAGKHAGGYASNRESTFTHEVFWIDLERAAALVWVQGPDDRPVKGLPARDFAASVSLLPAGD